MLGSLIWTAKPSPATTPQPPRNHDAAECPPSQPHRNTELNISGGACLRGHRFAIQPQWCASTASIDSHNCASAKCPQTAANVPVRKDHECADSVHLHSLPLRSTVQDGPVPYARPAALRSSPFRCPESEHTCPGVILADSHASRIQWLRCDLAGIDSLPSRAGPRAVTPCARIRGLPSQRRSNWGVTDTD